MDLTSRVALEDVGGNLDYNARPPDLFRRTIAWSREATSTFLYGPLVPIRCNYRTSDLEDLHYSMSMATYATIEASN
jgi:hypothetical protein